MYWWLDSFATPEKPERCDEWRSMRNKEGIIRIAAALVALVLTVSCVWVTKIYDIPTTNLKIVGSLVSVFIVAAGAWRFPIYFYVSALAFDFLAAALGSAVNLYNSIASYDRFVHFLSGVLLAEAGAIIFRYLLKKRGHAEDWVLTNCFAFVFSSACAGFWEIYEFATDCLIQASMQGSNNNTMGDIVSGVLGALLYVITVISVARFRRTSEKRR